VAGEEEEFLRALAGGSELEITVRGRRTGRLITLPVWFVQRGGMVHLLPVSGSDTNWYRNILKDPNMTLRAGRRSIEAVAEPEEDPGKVNEVIRLFKRKYGDREIDRWYTKLDIAVNIPLST